jgi:hypothetical protein
MPLFNAAMVIGANAIRAAMTHAQLHTGDPGSAGTNNVSSAARQPVSWTAATGNGDFDLLAEVSFTGGASGGACTWVSLWSALTGGTCYGKFALAGDTTFNAAGQYTLAEIVFDGSAT